MHESRRDSLELLELRRQIGRAVFAFSGRKGGVSSPPYDSLNLGLHVGDAEEAVRENRRRLLGALGVSSRPLVEAEQVHGSQVAVVADRWLKAHAGRRCVAPGADALVSGCERAVLSLYFADCVPLFMAESSGRAVGVAHAGWRGTVRGVAGGTVRAMCAQFGLAPSDITAVIGPCVGSCCYEVGGEVVEAVVASLPPSADAASVACAAETPSKWLLDLAGANAAQLRWAGVPDGSIVLTGRCTCCERGAFFSVRGDGPTTGRCGAFAYIAGSGSEAASDTARDA